MTEERIATDADRLTQALARSFTLGTDADGCRHHYYAPADTVVVFDGRTLDRREYLDGRPLSDWDAYVAQVRGWRTHGQFAALGLRVDAERKDGSDQPAAAVEAV